MPGEGSIYQRGSDGRWVATISTGPRGNRNVTTIYRPTKGEAIDALAELRSAHGRLNSRTTTVSTYLERWVRDVRKIRPTTRHGYRAVIETHLVPNLGHVRLAALTPLHVEELLAQLEPTMRPKTLRNVLVVLRRALTQAVRLDLVKRNVAAREYIDAPAVPTYEPDALSVDELGRILAALPGDPIETHVLVGLGTGLRQGEQLGLAWEDIDPGVIHVRLALARIEGRYRRVEPKTDRSRRDIPVPVAVSDALERHRAALIAAKFIPVATGPVFINADGGEMSGSVLTHRWYHLLERAGVRRRPWKVLRATYGSRLHAAGLDELAIAALMGHARTHTTRKHYLAASTADATAAIGAVLTYTPTDTASTVGDHLGPSRAVAGV